MASSGSVARSGASYEAVLIDKMTAEMDKLIEKTKELEGALKAAVEPADQVSKAIGNVGKAAARVSKIPAFSDHFLAGLTRARTLALSAGQGMSQMLHSVASGARSAGVALLAFSTISAAVFAKALSVSATAAEQQNKFNVSFGESADAANEWANSLASALGRSRTQVKSFAGDMQSFFVAAGHSADLAELLSKATTQLVFDLGSFREMADQDVFDLLRSGISGSSEAFERLNVFTKVATLDQYLLSKGLTITTQDLTEQQKQIVRVAKAFEDTAQAQGDVIRTMGSWSNLVKAAKAAFDELLVSIGATSERILLGSLKAVVNGLVGLRDVVSSINVGHLQSLFGMIAGAAVVGTGLLALATAFAGLASAVIAVSTAASGVIAFISFLITAPIVALGVAVAGLVTAMVGFAGLRGFFSSLASEVGLLMQAFDDLFVGLQFGLQGVAGALQKGDMELAAKIAALVIEIEFRKLAAVIKELLYNAIIEGLTEGAKVAGQRLKDLVMLPVLIPSKLVELGGSYLEGGEEVTAPEDVVKGLEDELRQLLAQAVPEPGQQSAGDKFMEGINKRLRDRLQEIIKSFEKVADPVEEAADSFEQARDRAADFARQFETPLERFARQIQEADKAARLLRSEELFIRARAAALAEYDRATQEAEDLPRGMRRASVGSTAAGFAANVGLFGPVFDPINDEQKKQTAIQEDLLTQAERTNTLLNQVQPWVFR